MKSEIDEFWYMLGSNNQKMQQRGFQKWDQFIEKNPQYFEKIKGKLEPSFCEIYEKVNFHDFQIQEITYQLKSPNKNQIILLLYDYYEDYGENIYFDIIYSNINQYTINVSQSEISWGNDIFEIVEDNMLKHRVLCSNDTSIQIIFEKISIVKHNGKQN